MSINITEIRFVVRALVDGTGYPYIKKGDFYRKGSWETGRGWYSSPFNASLFTAKEIKNVSRLQHGLLSSEVQVVEVEVSVTDQFQKPGGP